MNPSPTAQTTMVCSIDTNNLSNRLARIRLLAQRHLRSERQDGRALYLSYSKESSPELQSIVALERECCPYLVFDLKEDDAGIKLVISAPTDADGVTESLYDHFRGIAGSTPKRSCAGSGCGCAA